MIDTAHRKNIPVLVDGAQAIPPLPLMCKPWMRIFTCFGTQGLRSHRHRHTLRQRALAKSIATLPGGGEMIEKVSFEKTTYNELPLSLKQAPTILVLLP